MSDVAFVMDGAPVAKARPRFGYGGRVYTPQTTADYEGELRRLARQAMKGRSPLKGPVALFAAFYLPVPASYPAKLKKRALSGEFRPNVRPDLDNFLKSAADSLNKIVLNDDGQIVEIITTKFYSDQPRTEVIVRPLSGVGGQS